MLSFFRYYIQLKYGYVGKGVRIEIPTCVLTEIRVMFPEETEDKYMGFKSEWLFEVIVPC